VYVTVKTYTERIWRQRLRRCVVPVAGRRCRPRTSRTVFESLGLAAEDLAAVSYLYEKATRLAVGTVADF
jgi:ornithine cyclodeaminase/alanine dehydrogenase-like protein (mu-crystallin family)